jgi:hypothetical protein
MGHGSMRSARGSEAMLVEMIDLL